MPSRLSSSAPIRRSVRRPAHQIWTDAIRRRSGLCLVTGPTGAGKTNTVLASLGELNQPGVKICTAECPIEYNLHGVQQHEAEYAGPLNFAAWLRSFRRHGADIVQTKVEDYETAALACEMASAGMLIIGTMHTNDAPSTLSRFANMGVEPYAFVENVNAIVAQRLVRLICEKCRGPKHKSPAALRAVGFSESDASVVVPMAGTGCDACSGTGYKGRTAVFEVMSMTERLTEGVFQGASTTTLRRVAIQDGLITLRQAGLRKVAAGLTTIDEVVRATDLH